MSDKTKISDLSSQLNQPVHEGNTTDTRTGDLVRMVNTALGLDPNDCSSDPITNLETLVRQLLIQHRVQSIVLAVTRDFMTLHDNAGNLLYVNPQGEKVSGLELKEAIGKPLRWLGVDSEMIDIFTEEEIEQIRSGVAIYKEVKIKGECWMMELRPVIDENGVVQSIVGTHHNITQSKKQESLYQDEINRGVEVLARLTQGLTHDINNALAIINGNAQFGLISDDGEQKKDSLNNIIQAVRSLRIVLQRLGTLGRVKQAEMLEMNVKECIADALIDVQSQLTDIKVEYELIGKIPNTMIDYNILLLAFIEIFKNAVTATQDRRKSEDKSTYPNMQVEVFVEAFGDRNIFITTSDNGIGIPPDNILKIFQMYFSTIDNPSIKGLGSGLTVVERAGFLHEASLSISSITRGEKGSGIAFRIVDLHEGKVSTTVITDQQVSTSPVIFAATSPGTVFTISIPIRKKPK